MNFNKMDIIVRDVPAAVAFLRDVLGLAPVIEEKDFAEFPAGAAIIMLGSAALVPVEPLTGGIILHLQVPDVVQSLAQARMRGATMLRETMHTPWGSESAFLAGPEGLIIELYRPLA